ncbi:Cof-type HAD-IIB family hydrolase [Brachyspira hampsonii]|uniref:Cof-type HAD-IIB family hydrolase n=1 Tax=Brachyspira hampsonii TaxID=1287055 RepID=UPI000D3BE8E9|nr:Cof-type HAD-IIB family hydrolase [Brachyspira hampsonii]PTY40996.1 hydrolase [Brachyspira hampsonii bv. II]
MNVSKEKIKLIAADLDGTLLNSNKEISEYNQKIIKKLINEYNIDFILSSGRGFDGVKKYNDILDNSNYSIVMNGSNIIDFNGNVLYRKRLEENISKGIIKLAENYDVCLHFFDDLKYIVSKEDFPIKSYIQIEKTREITVGIENIEDYRFDKIIIFGNRKILNKLKIDIDSNFDVNSCFSGETLLEVICKDVSKGNALKWICNKKGIDIKNTIAFGDNFNDIEMIEYAGVGVAMGNAEENVKQKADYITLSNDEDGVGKFLSDIFSI